MRPKQLVSAFAAAVLLAIGAVAVIDAAPASAFTQNRITLSRAHRVADIDYGPIPGSFEESTTAVSPTPSGCGNDDGTSDTEDPPTFGTMCDRIPLRIVVPTDLAPGDDYVVGVAVSWTDSPGAATGNAGTVTDIDLHLYDNGQLALRADPEDTGHYTEITASAGTTIPESVKICCPDLVDYNIVVVNAGAGANTGYHVHAEMKILKADKIFELLAEPPSTTHPSTDDTLPPDLSNLPLLGPGLGDLGLAPDFGGDLSDLANAPLEDALQAPPTRGQSVGVSKPGPASGVAVALSLGVIPVGVLGSLIGFAIRRRNAAASLI